ncbi:MAG: M48 family metallopeptidase [Candidatus Omnitrophota bacterium]|jgi:predicted Zn-dependent protease
MKTIRYVGILFVLSAMTGCASLGSYVRGVNLVPVSDEVQIGTQMNTEITKQMTILPASSPETVKVRSMGQKLVAALPTKEFDYQFDVVKDATPNAFTIPGAHIYVHTGLLSFVDNDDQLAGVIAHEIGHAYERHPAKAITRQYGVDFVSGLLFKENQNQVKTLALNLAKQGVLTKFGRSDETQSDEIAYELLKKTGYSQDGLLMFFKKLTTIEKKQSFPFLSTHPPTAERIARIEELKRQDAPGITTATTAKL